MHFFKISLMRRVDRQTGYILHITYISGPTITIVYMVISPYEVITSEIEIN